MEIITRKEYNDILYSIGFKPLYMNKSVSFDIYHRNNWERYTKHWDEPIRNEEPLIADFFFDSKVMIEFFKTLTKEFKSKICYVAAPYTNRIKLLYPLDDIQRNIYSKFRNVYRTNELKVNTNKVLKLRVDELLDIIELWSISGFVGLSEHTLLFPYDKLSIMAYHHMNYLIYTNDGAKIKGKIKNIIPEELCLFPCDDACN